MRSLSSISVTSPPNIVAASQAARRTRRRGETWTIPIPPPRPIPPPPPAPSTAVRSAVEVAIRLGAIALLVGWCLVIIAPFLDVVVWGLIIAIAADGPFDWLCARLGGRRRLAGVLGVSGVLLALAIPTAIFSETLFDGAQSLARELREGLLRVPEPEPWVRDLPLVGDSAYDLWLGASENLGAGVAALRAPAAGGESMAARTARRREHRPDRDHRLHPDRWLHARPCRDAPARTAPVRASHGRRRARHPSPDHRHRHDPQRRPGHRRRRRDPVRARGAGLPRGGRTGCGPVGAARARCGGDPGPRPDRHDRAGRGRLPDAVADGGGRPADLVRDRRRGGQTS